MKVLILGMGHIGKALASKLKDNGHTVVGTTTTQSKVTDLEKFADEIFVLSGNETAKVFAAAAACDSIVVTVAPNVKNTRTIEERHHHYNHVLVKSCNSARAACDRTVFLSSFSVYGDGGPGNDPVDERTSTSNNDEPSSKYYQLAEQSILSNEQGCVLRFPDMYGAPGDMSFAQRVQMAHEHFAGKAIFSADAPLYAIHFEDVVNAVYHALENNLVGIFNVCDNENIPATNQVVFDAICQDLGLSPLEFLNQIKAPNRRISAQKIVDTGYKIRHEDPNAAVVAHSVKG